MEEGEEAWKKDHRGRYARIADDKCKLEIVSLQKEKEVEVNAMREKNDPRMTERGSREEEYNAPLDKTRQLLHRGVEALTSHAPMAIFSRARFATPVSYVTKDNILNTLNKVGVNFQRTKKSYALFWFSEPFA